MNIFNIVKILMKWGLCVFFAYTTLTVNVAKACHVDSDSQIEILIPADYSKQQHINDTTHVIFDIGGLLSDLWQNIDFKNAANISPQLLDSLARDYVKILKTINDTLIRNIALDDHLTNIAEAGMFDNEVLYVFLDLYNSILVDKYSPEQDLLMFRDFMSAYLRSSKITEMDKIAVRYIMEGMNLNMPGDYASTYKIEAKKTDINNEIDFKQLLSMNLRNNGVNVVFFYAPDCSECDMVIEELKIYEPLINSMIEEGSLQMIAVYAGEDHQLWKKKGWQKIPDNWLNVWAMDGDMVKQNYAINTTPMIYVIDNLGKVIMRDISPQKLVEKVLEHRN